MQILVGTLCVYNSNSNIIIFIIFVTIIHNSDYIEDRFRFSFSQFLRVHTKKIKIYIIYYTI